MDYPNYPKLNPIRTSYSLYKRWVIHDWVSIWEYYTEQRYRSQPNPQDLAHRYIEQEGIKVIQGLERLHNEQLVYEQPIVREFDWFSIVGRPDAYNREKVLDWKFGGTNGAEQQVQLYMWLIGEECRTGYVIGADATVINDVVFTVKSRQVKRYQRSKHCGDWLYRMEEMANDVRHMIKKGRLHKFLSGEL